MDIRLLELLRCPFCGGPLKLEQGASREARNGDVTTGILSCHCCAYPIVAGIPYLRDDPQGAAVTRLLGEGKRERALLALLGLDGAGGRRHLKRMPGHGRPLTLRRALHWLGPDAGKAYFLYRFSDPTFLCSQAVLRVIGQDRRCFARPSLDLGGGLGHLTRSLCTLAAPQAVLLANISFRELWLAKRFVAPACHPICCDANRPLPFAKDAFSLVFCSDAFHYIWAKRMLACEMSRLIGGRGLIVLTHLHNSQVENCSAGMPLTPGHYRALFEGWPTRLFKESDVLEAVLAHQPIDLSAGASDDAVGQEPALILIATRLAGLFRTYECPAVAPQARALSINPLYKLRRDGGRAFLKLRFPSREYQREFAPSRRYLPASVELKRGVLEKLERGQPSQELGILAARYVLLDLPADYL